MKKQGYYDLLINEIDDSFNTKKLSEISNVNEWLTTQISMSIKEKLNSFSSIEEKVAYLSKINNEINLDSKQLNSVGVKNKIKHINLSQTRFYSQPIHKELMNELATCDQVNIVTAFTSSQMINQLRNYMDNNPKLKLKFITTLYNGISNIYVLDLLPKLINDFPNRIEIRVQNTFNPNFKNAIHAKSYNFIRKTGFSNLYIGSSNFSQNGLTNYQEFNLKISEFSNQQLYLEHNKSFETLFNAKDMVNPLDYQEFEDMKSKALKKKSSFKTIKVNYDEFEESSSILKAPKFELREYQKEALEAIKEATAKGKHKHLLVMATGTGKTVTIGFRIKQFYDNLGYIPTVLFVAPRKEILEQSLKTFKLILDIENNDFQKNYDGHQLDKANMHNHIILGTNQSLKNNLETLSNTKFDLVIFDEAHHVEADSLQKIYDVIEPTTTEIIGLTATPQRTDGVHIMKYFLNEIRFELGLFNAVDQQILVDFDYYFINDNSVDEIKIDISKDKELEKILNTTRRNEFVKDTINKYISQDDKNVKALLFCSTVKHALGVSKYLHDHGFKTNTIASQTWDDNFENTIGLTADKRTELQEKFKTGAINFLTTVDMFSEGIDIPEINKIFFLRPTQSSLVYLQQLGRGLRKFEEKRLEVFDFVNNIDVSVNKNYNPLSFIRSIDSNFNIKDCLDSGMKLDIYSPGNSLFNFKKADLEKIKLKLKEKQSIFNQISKKTLNNYRERNFDNYTNYQAYFNEENINLYDFYINSRALFFKAKYKDDRLKFMALALLNNKEIVEEIILMLESKKLSDNELINLYLIGNYFVSDSESAQKYNDKLTIDKLFSHILSDEHFVNETLCMMQYKLKYDNFYHLDIDDNIDSWKGVYISNRVIALMLTKNYEKYLMGGLFQKSFNKLDGNNYGILKMNEPDIEDYNLDYVNHFDYEKKIMTALVVSQWTENKKTKVQKEFEDDELKIAILYKSKKIIDEYNLTSIKHVGWLPVHEFLGFKKEIIKSFNWLQNDHNQYVYMIKVG